MNEHAYCLERAEIENLLERYCWTVDHQQWDEWASLFAEDGVFDVRGQQLKGRDAILTFVQNDIGDWQLVRHLAHQAGIEILGPNKAKVRCYFELRGKTARGNGVEALGAYEDDLVKSDDGWKFQVRKARFDYFVRKGEPWDSGGDPVGS